jgi:hypothetical protein
MDFFYHLALTISDSILVERKRQKSNKLNNEILKNRVAALL